jgi:hypothetical protein
MKPKLALSLAGGLMLLQVIWPAPGHGVRGLLRALIPARKAQLQTPVQQPALQVGAHYVCAPEYMGPEFDQLISQLKAKSVLPLAGVDLEVQLGLDHSHIGLMTLADAAATSLSSAALASYAQAWVGQMLHLDPATQIVRQRILADPRKVLISCIDRAVFDALHEFSSRHGLRFKSCRPAVLSAIATEQAGSSAQNGRTVVCTDWDADGARSNRIQLLRFDGNELVAAWRGWVPALLSVGTDTQLEGAIRRFNAHIAARFTDAQIQLHRPGIAAEVLRA